MNRTVKWILGVVLGLVALCILAAVSFFAISRLNLGAVAVGRRAFLPFEGQRSLPMAPFQGMHYRHFGGFSPFGFFGGWLIIAALLGLFALAVVAMVLILRRPSRPMLQSVASSSQIPPNQSTAPMQSTAFDQSAAINQPADSNQPVAPDMTPSPTAAGQNCPSCGRSIQADWSHCPYCGTALSGSA